jgi:arginyl-tRNA synthetase
MDPFRHIAAIIEGALDDLERTGALPGGLARTGIAVEPPRDAAHGDIATNAALVLAKPAGKAPREVAALLLPRLAAGAGVAKAEAAGPGFINLTLSEEFWRACLAGIVGAGPAYGAQDLGQGAKVNIEYVSANPTGPMHVGHVRGAVFGDALANLLEKMGYAVNREYYINDAGAQVDILARSAFLRYREALGEAIGEIPEGLYPGDYLVPVGTGLARAHGPALLKLSEAEWLPLVREAAIAAMLGLIRDDLAALGVVHETFFSERSLQTAPENGPSKLAATLQLLERKGLVYRGVLEAPKGKTPEDWEPREQTLFRATQFGDDVDRPLLKSDGSFTYFASDIAYHRDKFERGFHQMINVLGADHAGYVTRLKAAVKAVSDGDASLDVKVCQLVRLFRAGSPVKMSKRAGTFVTLREVVDEVGAGVVRFIMLFRKNDAGLDFDFQKVTEQSKDNPVFYVQYAHARVRSVLRVAAEHLLAANMSDAALAAADLNVLGDPAELAVIKHLAQYPRILEQAALAHEPHRIAFFLYDLASAFHALWNRGREEPDLRFVIPERRDATIARLCLIRAVGLVLGSGLRVLGVEPVEEMR